MILRIFKFLLILFVLHISEITLTHASTHWFVNEEGRIIPQMDSMFSIRRPHDLIALMRQEQRAVALEELKSRLVTQKEDIDRLEDKETDVEGRIYSTDPDCIAAGKPLVEFDLYLSAAAKFPPDLEREMGLSNHSFHDEFPLMEPNCSEISDLPFSMTAFEHLLSIQERQNLCISREKELYTVYSSLPFHQEFAHAVANSLVMNKTSWVMYNMASIYWRDLGNANQAIDCLRSALHYSPRNYRHIALLGLGTVLHRARRSEEAVIVLHAAVDHNPTLGVAHFELGKVYAVLMEYNKSLVCLENGLRLHPDFVHAKDLFHAVKCHAKLEAALEAQHSSLQRTLSELRDYQQQQETWLRYHERLVSEQAPLEARIEQRLVYEEFRLRQQGQSVVSRSGTCTLAITHHVQVCV